LNVKLIPSNKISYLYAPNSFPMLYIKAINFEDLEGCWVF
jgi:hypothetical protein